MNPFQSNPWQLLQAQQANLLALQAFQALISSPKMAPVLAPFSNNFAVPAAYQQTLQLSSLLNGLPSRMLSTQPLLPSTTNLDFRIPLNTKLTSQLQPNTRGAETTQPSASSMLSSDLSKMTNGSPNNLVSQQKEEEDEPKSHDSPTKIEDNEETVKSKPSVTKVRKSKKIKRKRIMCGHTDRKHYAKGLCSNCYHRRGREKKPKQSAEKVAAKEPKELDETESQEESEPQMD